MFKKLFQNYINLIYNLIKSSRNWSIYESCAILIVNIWSVIPQSQIWSLYCHFIVGKQTIVLQAVKTINLFHV